MEINVKDLEKFFFCSKKLYLNNNDTSYNKCINALNGIMNSILYRKMIHKNIRLKSIQKIWNSSHLKNDPILHSIMTNWLINFIKKYEDYKGEIRAISVPFCLSIRPGLNIHGEIPIIEESNYGFNILFFNFNDPYYEHMNNSCLYSIYKKAFENEFEKPLDNIKIYNLPYSKESNVFINSVDHQKNLAIVEWIAEGINEKIEYPNNRQQCIICEYFNMCDKKY